MPFTKEQLRAYWKANKAILNQKRRKKRRLARLAVSREVSQMANLSPVSRESSPGKPSLEMANPKLTQLIHQYQTNTNYSCAPGCNENKYCSNCWYFSASELVNYKEVRM